MKKRENAAREFDITDPDVLADIIDFLTRDLPEVMGKAFFLFGKTIHIGMENYYADENDKEGTHTFEVTITNKMRTPFLDTIVGEALAAMDNAMNGESTPKEMKQRMAEAVRSIRAAGTFREAAIKDCEEAETKGKLVNNASLETKYKVMEVFEKAYEELFGKKGKAGDEKKDEA